MSKNVHPLSGPKGVLASRAPLRMATRVAWLCFLLPPLAGCGMNKVYQPPEVPYDYRDRHPLVLAEAQTTVDLFPHVVDGVLDPETRLRLHEFAMRYRRFGEGRITMLAPIGGPGAGMSRRELELVRQTLAAEGVGRTLFVSTYPVNDTKLASPLRLYFTGLKAQVAGKCGEWPDDLASGTSLDGWQNRTYWNFGCATQSTLAAQIADPRDIVDPRGETPQDVETRMRAITALRANGLSK